LAADSAVHDARADRRVSALRALATPALLMSCALLALVTPSDSWAADGPVARPALAARTTHLQHTAAGPASSVNLGRSPSGPPLLAPGGETIGAGEGESGVQSAPEADPLVSNGLGSPLCQGALAVQELTTAARANCETSGFVAAGSPTGNYGLDVHIDTGFLGVSEGGLLSVVQDLFISPVWMALVWAVHALVVMLEWCFTIDLLDSASVGLGSGLRQMQASLTEPWLAGVLAFAAVLAVYNGLIRRRIGEALGQAMLAMAMMAAGLWVIVDPTGTVGALGSWANQASLGTLAASARGSPAAAGGTLADSMAVLFAATIEAPWCYLEFGDVGWCRSPARLDTGLHAAALNIARSETDRAECGRSSNPLASCTAADPTTAKALERSAQLLRSARSNGALFLALPANAPERNSINDERSLLRVMCESSRATSCHGAMAAQAEFRTNGGTWKRVGGLLLIISGALGMLLLFGYVALRLLAAAIFSLLYLLLAPAAVLAPALGDAGRLVFRRWAGRLLGAVIAKLLFACVLGVLLAVLAILASLQQLGWWTQWLLMSAFWWGAYGHRHRALAIARDGPAHESRPPWRHVVRRPGDLLRPPRTAIRAARVFAGRLPEQTSRAQSRSQTVRATYARARARLTEQAKRSLEHDRRETADHVAQGPVLREQLSAKRTQLSRIERARDDAEARGDGRRVASLNHRAARVEEEISGTQQELNASRRLARTPGGEQLARRERLLDAQARLPASTDDGARQRDYAALAGLAGYRRDEYERLDPRRQRLARLQVDRELALRREISPAANDVVARYEGFGPRAGARAQRALDRALERRMREAGDRMPARPADPIDAWIHAARKRQRDEHPALPSRVMSDAREVAQRRKRQLGRGRP
jgi:hypothetical protein